MNESIKAFLKKLAVDENLAAKFKACKSPDEAYAVASSVADGFTKEEFFAVMEQLKAVSNVDSELTEADLAKMSGGNLADTADIISLTAASVSASLTAVFSAI